MDRKKPSLAVAIIGWILMVLVGYAWIIWTCWVVARLTVKELTMQCQTTNDYGMQTMQCRTDSDK